MQPPTPRPAVLLVYPDPVVRRLVDEMLAEFAGCHVHVARTCAAAGAWLAGARPDLVILPYGPRALHAPRPAAGLSADPRLAEVPLLYLATVDRPDGGDGVRAHTYWLTLPFSLDELTAAVATALHPA